MPHSEFASTIVALGLTCHDPSDFEGQNLLEIMNSRLVQYGDEKTMGAPVSGPATSASCDSIIPG